MHNGGAPAEGAKRCTDPDVGALQRAASRAEEAASRVEQHGLMHGALRTGQDESPASPHRVDLGSTSEVTEQKILDHNQVALRAEETAASVHAMVHQSMHAATDFAVPSRRTHTNVDQFFRVGVDGRSGFEKAPRAESKAEAAAVRVGSHIINRQHSDLSTDEAASTIRHVRQSPLVDILSSPDQSLKVPVPLTPDDSCEDSSEKHNSEPPFSSFESESKRSPPANLSSFEHIAVSTSNTNNGRPPKQNFIDRLAKESEQPSPEAPVMPRKRGRPRGSKSSAYTRRSTEKLQNGERVLSFPAGQNSQASSVDPIIPQISMIGLPLPLTVQGLPLGGSVGLERKSDDASSLGVSVQTRNVSTSSTGTALVWGNSLTKVSSVTGSPAQLAQENDLLKIMFKAEIGPIMDEVMKSYESRLPRDVLIAVGKAFASQILNKKLRQSLREGEQSVTPLFKRIARGTLQRMLLQKLRERHDSSTGPLASSSADNSRAALYLPQGPISAISDKYEKRSDGVLKGRELQPAVRDVQDRTSNTYSLDGGRSPRPDSEAGFVAAPDHEPHQSPQLEAASSPVLESGELVQAGDPVGEDSDVSTDTLMRDGLLHEQHQPEALNTSTPERSFVIVPQPRPLNVSSGSLFLHFDAIDTTSEPRHPESVLNTAEGNSRSSSQPETHLRDSNQVDSGLRPQLAYSHSQLSRELPQLQPASSQSRPSQGVYQRQEPPQLPQQHTEITDDMQTRQQRRVNYTERDPLEESDPSESEPETMVRPRRRRAERSPSPPPDPAAYRHFCYVPQPVTRNYSSALRHRELGTESGHSSFNCNKGMHAAVRTHFSQRLSCWRSWTGASKDIVTAAWSPNSSMYAVGASTEMDNLNIQYNRPNNLLLGDNAMNTLTELPEHYIDRPRPETIRSGDNSRQGTYNAVDPELYTTVSHVSFNHKGDRLFSTSFDKTLKIWDVSSAKEAKCLQTIRQEAQIELLALSHKPIELLATGQRTMFEPIRIYDIEKYGHEDSKNDSSAEMSSSRAAKFKLHPTCLQWGPSPSTATMLLVGFSESRTDGGPDQEGDLCLWDVAGDWDDNKGVKLIPAAQAVMDIAWHPSLPMFAAAAAPGSRASLTDRRTQSVIRTYEPRRGPGRVIEYECPALDINDVRFHPFDQHYISAGCTNGTTYVWDKRKPQTIMQKLRHSLPIDTLDHALSREEQDTGVRFTAWSGDGLSLYTGSSDGIIKEWNIFASPDDAFVRDVAQFDAGVMTGSFSPDQIDLVVGLSKGSVHVLSCAPRTHDPNENDEDEESWSDTDEPRKAYEAIKYVPFSRPAPAEAPTGVDIARDLLASGQLAMHPIYGAGKGPNYEGPYATYPRPKGVDLTFEDLDPDTLASQLDPTERQRGSRLGGSQDKAAQQRYRLAQKLAEARNGPAWFEEQKCQGNKWQFKKGEVWWDVEAEDEEEDKKNGEGADSGGKEEETEVKRETVAPVWEGKEVIVIDDD